MKRMLLLACLVLGLGAVVARAQSPQPYKVVFDLTSTDAFDQQAVLRWIKEVSSVNPKTEMEVVMYGRGLNLVVASKTSLADAVQAAIRDSHVRFNVCAIAMKNQQVQKQDLLPNVQVVPDGIGEIVAKQRAGWGYIKVGH